jgi:hypothetical protein
MNFITREQFDAALIVLETALKNGQVSEGSSGTGLRKIMLTDDDRNPTGVLCRVAQTIFVPPVQAARNKIHLVRNNLKVQKEMDSKTKDLMIKLEQEVEALTRLIQTLKE